MIPINLMYPPYLVHHFLENSAAKLPNKVALICGDQRLTYQQINQLSNQLSYSLIDMGIKRQDRVIIFLDNSAEAVISLFGI
jgi:acyl-CoA synthetase (AMP-forming)/AMP-acid ligase II